MSASVPAPPVVASTPGTQFEPFHFNTCPGVGGVVTVSTSLSALTLKVPMPEIYPASFVSEVMLSLGCTAESANVPCEEVAAFVIPYPAIVVGLFVNAPNVPSNASVIPYPDIVVGLLVRSAKATVVKNPLSFVRLLVAVGTSDKLASSTQLLL